MTELSGEDRQAQIAAQQERRALVEFTNKLFAKPMEFALGITTVEGLPSGQRVEIAIAGRSNVGKSSLINAIASQSKLARVSQTPGCTSQLNFYRMGDGQDMAYLVDLPGYGFAKAAKSEVAEWNRLIRDYLRGRAMLRRVFVLVDARRGLLEKDEEVMTLLDESAVSYQLIFTKIDQVKKSELESLFASAKALERKHPALHPICLATSSAKNIGIDDVREAIATVLAGNRWTK